MPLLSITIVRSDLFEYQKMIYNASSILNGQPVRIKIGIEKKTTDRSMSKAFWIEFDPNLQGELRSNSLIMPYIVVPKKTQSIKTTNFHVNSKVPACSSIYETTKWGTCLPDNAFIEAFRNSCAHVGSHPELYGPIKLWGNAGSTIEETERSAVKASVQCMNYCKGLPPRSLPSITLSEVIDLLPSNTPIELVDIDAQGADVGIVLSLKDYLSRIRHIQIECQLGMYMYDSPVQNNCTIAEEFLTNNGFYRNALEVNNCGILEFNLRMSNSNHSSRNSSTGHIAWDGG
jgi:hypothetical protein